MKTINTIITLLIATTVFLNLNAQTANFPSFQIPTGWEIEENWLEAYQEKIGANVSATWIMDQIADGAQMLTSKSTNGFILIQKQEVDEAISTQEDLEEGINGGNGTALYASSEVEVLNHSLAISYKGKIAGLEVQGRRISNLSPCGTYEISILSISTDLTGTTEIVHGQARKIASSVDFNEQSQLSARAPIK